MKNTQLRHGQFCTFYSYKGGVGRTMALCNTAARIAVELSPTAGRVLCVDLDFDAPGMASFLPHRAEPSPGLLGFFARRKREEITFEEAQRALSEYLSAAIIPIAGFKNLFTLPPFDRTKSLSVKAFHLLERAITAPNGGFAAQLRQVLSEQFDYVLVDSRPGQLRSASLLGIQLADTVVAMFRPNEEQFAGIRESIEAFPARAGRCIVPVLSPRPPESHLQLAKMRGLARKYFQEIGPQAGVNYTPSLIELPYDVAAEYSSSLSLGPDETVLVADSESPLAKAYGELTDCIRMLNPAGDLDGLRMLEGYHYTEGRKDLAFSCLIEAIRARRDVDWLWENIAEGYEWHLTEDAGSKAILHALCADTVARVDEPAIARFHANLWLAQTVTPRLRARHVREAWRLAPTLGATSIMRALAGLADHYEVVDRPVEHGLPGARQTAELLVFAKLSQSDDASAVRQAMYYAGLTYQNPASVGDAQQAYRHQLQVSDASWLRARILHDLASIHLRLGELPEALQLSCEASRIPEAAPWITEQYVDIASRCVQDFTISGITGLDPDYALLACQRTGQFCRVDAKLRVDQEYLSELPDPILAELLFFHLAERRQEHTAVFLAEIQRRELRTAPFFAALAEHREGRTSGVSREVGEHAFTVLRLYSFVAPPTEHPALHCAALWDVDRLVELAALQWRDETAWRIVQRSWQLLLEAVHHSSTEADRLCRAYILNTGGGLLLRRILEEQGRTALPSAEPMHFPHAPLQPLGPDFFTTPSAHEIAVAREPIRRRWLSVLRERLHPEFAEVLEKLAAPPMPKSSTI